MANEFKIKKGLIVTGASGGTVVDIQGSQGQLFSVTDDLSGSIFAVSDISGVPIFDVNSSGISYFDGKLGIGLTPTTVNLEVKSIQDISFDEGIGVVRSNTSQTGYINMVGGAMNINAPNAIPIKFRDGGNTNLTIGGDGSATFEGTIDSGAITSTGTVSADTYFESTDASLVLGTTGAGTIFLRPNGIGSGTGAMSVSSSGTISTGGIIDMNSNKITELSPGTTNLDAVNYQQLQDAIAGVLVYQGTWNASTNTPTLTSGVGTPGYYYIVSVAGSTNLDGITDWLPGDWAIFSDLATDAWQKIDHTNVLNGAGTGQKVTKWDGSGTSYALTDGPITFSGNNSTFAGNVTATSGIFSDVATLETKLNGNDSALNFTTASGDTFRIGLKDSDDTFRIAKSDASLATNTYLTINSSGNSTFAGDATVNGTIASLNTNDFGTIRFGNNGNRYVRGNSAELQIGSALNNIHFQSTGANRIDSGAADGTAAFRINARTSHTSGNLFEVTNANSIKLAIDYDGDTTFAGTVTAADLLTVNGDGHLFLGADGETPKIDMMYDDHVSGAGWDTRIFTGKTDDLPNGQSFPTSTIAGGYGTQYQANSDGAFFGIIPYTAGHFRPIINWGDDATDTPFSFQFNGTNIVNISYAGTVSAPIFDGDHKGTINTATTGVTQTAGNNSTLIATTAYADAAAAAVPIGNYLPLAGGTMTGTNGVVLPDNFILNVGTGNDLRIKHNATNSFIENHTGDLSIVNYANDKELVLWNDDGTGGIAKYLVLDGNTTHAYFTNPGNVGIGTTSPSNKLTVNQGGGVRVTGISNGTYIEMSGDLPGYTANAYPVIKSGGTIHFANNGKYSAYIEGNNTYFGILDGAITTKVLLHTSGNSYFNGGNVGIGTTSPASKLVVEGAGEQWISVFTTDITGAGAENGYRTQTSTGSRQNTLYRHTATNLVTLRAGTDDGAINFIAGGSAAERMRILANGNVGIGDTAPTSISANTFSLSINSSRNDLTGALISKANGSIKHQQYWDSSGYGFILTASSGDFKWNFGSSEKMRLTEAGNLGIGTSTPLAKLDIQGTQGQLFSVTNDLSGSIFAVSDISGVPIFDVNSSGVSYFDGNVGIGTTSPTDYYPGADNLVIKQASGEGGMSIVTANDTSGAIYFADGTTGSEQYRGGIGYTHSTDKLFLVSGGQTRAWIDTNGNVGIGENNPTSLLHLKKASGDPMLNIQAVSAGDPGITFTSINNRTGNIFYSDGTTNAKLTYDHADTSFKLYAHNTSVADFVLNETTSYFPTQNVGIGVTSPNQKLHVNDGGVRVEKNATGLGGFITIGNATETAGNYSAYFFGNTPSDTDYFKGGIAYETLSATFGRGDMHFLQNDSNDATSATISDSVMTILNGGNVGIGTTSPSRKLDVVGVIQAQGAFYSTVSSSSTNLATANGGQLSLYNSNSTDGNFSNIGGYNSNSLVTSQICFVNESHANRTGAIVFLTHNGGSMPERMRITSDGGIGINTTNPTEKLEVNGNVKVQGDIIVNSDIELGPSSRIQLDDTPTASTASGSGTIVNWSVSDTTTAGTLYTVKTNGLWTPVDADNEATSIGMLAIALGSNANLGMLLQGFFYKASHGFTIGLPLYISNTAGAFTTTRPTGTNDYVRIIGYATSTNYIYFDPDKTWVQVA